MSNLFEKEERNINTIKNKREVLFLWDGENFNPNGDMLKNNAPRFDEASQKAETTDVRIKRTIRDFALMKGENIFVKEYVSDKGIVADCKSAAVMVGIDNSLSENEVIKQAQQFFDIRAFGTVMPLKKSDKKGTDSINLTGAMQIGMSKTIHQTEVEHIQGTGAFASGDGKTQATFRAESMLKYGMFATSAVVSPYNALKTGYTEEDYFNTLKYLWNGTQNLITRTKAGQKSRLLIDIKYKEESDSFVGRCHNLVDTVGKNDATELNYRGVKDFDVNLDRLIKKIEALNDEIEEVRYFIDNDINVVEIPQNWIKDDKLK